MVLISTEQDRTEYYQYYKGNIQQSVTAEETQFDAQIDNYKKCQVDIKAFHVYSLGLLLSRKFYETSQNFRLYICNFDINTQKDDSWARKSSPNLYLLCSDIFK